LLGLFDIDDEVASDAQYFVVTSIPTFLCHLLFDCNRQYLNATHQSKIVFYAFSSATVLHSIWCYIFIIEMDLGITGAAFANLIHAFCCFIITAIYLTWFAAEPIPFFSCLPGTFAWSHVKPYLAIGTPSILLICLEWWGFEVLVLMSGVFSNTAVAA
jgi:MATE family multidrug resistance protein